MTTYWHRRYRSFPGRFYDWLENPPGFLVLVKLFGFSFGLAALVVSLTYAIGWFSRP